MAVCYILKSLLLIYIASSYKSIPLAYYFRFYYFVVTRLILPSKFKSLRQDIKSPFETRSIHTYNSPFECDFYFHKSNSSYFTELDIARTQLVSSILQKFFLEYPTESKSWPFVPVASIFGTFRKEIKPFQRYEIRSRILSWDNKWLFIYSKFIINKDKLACASVTKYVFKDGRKTIPPREALKVAGLYSEEAELKSQENYKLVEAFVDNQELENVPTDILNKF